MNSLLCEQKNATRAKGERSLELKNTLQKKDRLETVILSSAVVKTNKALNLPRTLDFLDYYRFTCRDEKQLLFLKASILSSHSTTEFLAMLTHHF